MSKNLTHFGTDGIRKKSTEFTPSLLYKIVRGLSDYAEGTPKVLLAGDTRESTQQILSYLASACEACHIEYALADVLPTPAINYCFYKMGFDFAIDVTASHNPYTDNGIKIFERSKNTNGHGVKLSKAGKAIIEASLSSDVSQSLEPVSSSINLHAEALEHYQAHLLDYLGKTDFAGLKIGLDCANGATSVINKQVFESLGASVTLINADLSYGTKINADCGSTHLEAIRQCVLENHLDFGIAFDGDGDRVLMIDAEGNEVDGDQIIAILANYLKLNKIAVTVMANQGLLNWAKSNNIYTEITDVGDSNVYLAMEEKGISLGGEQSGHVILPGEPTGDGMLTALMVTKVIAESKKSLKELAGIFIKLPQATMNLEADAEQKALLKSSDEVKRILTEFSEKATSMNGRILVRPSGTENLIRITVWGETLSNVTSLVEELKNKLKEVL